MGRERVFKSLPGDSEALRSEHFTSALIHISLHRRCALVALEDVKAYLLEECGQIAVRLFWPKCGFITHQGSSELPRVFGNQMIIPSDLRLV